MSEQHTRTRINCLYSRIEYLEQLCHEYRCEIHRLDNKVTQNLHTINQLNEIKVKQEARINYLTDALKDTAEALNKIVDEDSPATTQQ